MTGQTIVEKIKSLIMPILSARHLELVDLEFKREGERQYLRVFIDKPGGVTLEDCQDVSRESEVILDIEDAIPTQYVFEVSSPGLDRPLKTIQDYQRLLGRVVKIKTYQAVHGKKKFVGHLQKIVEDQAESSWVVDIRTIDPQETLSIPFQLISSARLEVEF